MEHILQFNEHYLTIQFRGEISTSDSELIANQIIHFLREPQKKTVDVVIDIRNATLPGISPIVNMAVRLQVHLRHFNYCYVLGDQIKENYEYTFNFFKLIQAKRDKVQLVNSYGDAMVDINQRLLAYKSILPDQH